MSGHLDLEKGSEANNIVNPPRALPNAALKALEPRVGGFWAVTGQDPSTGAFSMTYFMDKGNEAATYTMRACASEDELHQNCAKRIYKFSPLVQNNSNVKKDVTPAFPIPDHDELSANHTLRDQQAFFNVMASNPFRATQGMVNYNSSVPLPSVLPTVSHGLPSRTRSVEQRSTSQALPCTEGALSFTCAHSGMSNEKFQELDSPSDNQSLLDVHGPVKMDWGFSEEILPTPAESFMGQEDINNLNGHFDDAAHFFEDPFNPTMANSLWTQFDMRDHMDNMFTTP